MDTIREHAFPTRHNKVKTDLPVILSLEVHCSLPQQQEMARIFETGLGDLLKVFVYL